MKNNIIIGISFYFVALTGSGLFAQQVAQIAEKKWYQTNNIAELSIAANGTEFSPSLNIQHLHGIGKKQNFKIGYGLRFSSYFGQDKEYTTAPAKLTSGEEGPQVLFSDFKKENIDTVFIKYPQVNSLNLFIVLQYTFFKKLDLGFNIDAIGFSFGGKHNGGYKLNESQASNPYLSNQQVVPTTLNLLLVSDNDIGSLNSELFLRYRFNSHWGMKGGFTFMFSEFTTENKLRLDNDRFRYKSSMAMLGVSYLF